ncbi:MULTISPECIES: hypothetical protein [unclassified Methylobacterium]|uniref:hypothetical protein n=1 Tax=unclassified Methylobacterium TaxID=2615210 RepID=UPI000AF1D1BC|nr:MULTISPECIES: hypothetical protein [unclassified Methylobacterium]
MKQSITLAAGLIAAGLFFAPAAVSAAPMPVPTADVAPLATDTVQYGYGRRGYGGGYGRGGYGRGGYGNRGYGRGGYGGRGYGRGGYGGYGRGGYGRGPARIGIGPGNILGGGPGYIGRGF